MESVLDSPELAIPTSDELAGQQCDEKWNIAMSVSLDADTRRIFQALTVPEYLETWIDMPDHTPSSRLLASPDANGYRLDYFSANHISVSIFCSYLSCHQRKMRLHWRRNCHQGPTGSIVDFRLRGNFRTSILELRHIALGSSEEFRWHQQLWEGSLAKLASLLRSA
ncbi:MAG TPA: hypothetical protein VGG45_04900 [Terracidiphilus sp.]